MISIRELTSLMKAIAGVVREHVSTTFFVLANRLDVVEKSLRAMPNINLDDMEEKITDKLLKNVPVPKNGENGKGITVEDVAPFLDQLVEEKIKKLPAAKDGEHGKDADPEFIQQCVAQAVATIPPAQKGEDGKSVSVEDILPLLDQLAEEKIKKIPVPKDGENGKDADPEFIQQCVAQAVAAIPLAQKGEDGKSISIDDILPLLDQLAEEKIKKMPVPKDGEHGKDADPEFIQQCIEDAVAKLPAAQKGEDGKSVTVEEITLLLDQLVTEKIITLPMRDFPVERVQRAVDEAVASALASVSLPKDGAPGRDATHLDILPAIDPQKSYARGIYSTHRGGLWRSFETTEKMKGWECIVEGIADIQFEKNSDRQFTLQVVRSSGCIEKNIMALPVMIYRGVYCEGEYEAGDTVTWAGSLWHCNETTCDKPGEGGCWTLCAKKGRDGKDGKHGRDLVKGVAL
jgi:hypothetical protein